MKERRKERKNKEGGEVGIGFKRRVSLNDTKKEKKGNRSLRGEKGEWSR